MPEFGTHGLVELSPGITGDVEGRTSLVSPPIVFKDLLITGGNNGEQAPSLGLYGDIRAWDARTGALKWTFHTVPRAGEPGVETWEGDSWKNRSGTNMWSFFTIDAERGLLYVPLGSPTADYYGGDRKGKNLYGNSIVALDVATGALKWHQQLVHHDLWDFDLPAAPTLIDVRRDGKTIPAVAVLTKVTLLFVFDRVTGAPIFGMEERPVPQEHRAGRAGVADAAVSAEAAAARPHRLRPGQGLLHPHAGARGLLPGAVDDQQDVHRGRLHAARARPHDGHLPEHARRRQLERPGLRRRARPGVHQRDEHRPGGADGVRARIGAAARKATGGSARGAARSAGSGTPRTRSRARRRRSASWWR